MQRTQRGSRASNRDLLELQRATAVANSQTLADFILKAGRFLKSPFTPGEGEHDTGETIPQ